MKISRADRADAATLLDLLCSASAEIKLEPRVCDKAFQDEYLSWMGHKCASGRVSVAAVANEILGFLMFDGVQVIEYVVIHEAHRRKGIGEKLVQQFVSGVNHAYLKAEARNPASQRMLEKCGFAHEGDHTSQFPVLVLRRGSP